MRQRVKSSLMAITTRQSVTQFNRFDSLQRCQGETLANEWDQRAVTLMAVSGKP